MAVLRSGLSFDDLAKERGLNPTDVDLGMVAKSAIIDPAIANAAFSLRSGEVSQPVQGKFGVALVKIGKIEPGTSRFSGVSELVAALLVQLLGIVLGDIGPLADLVGRNHHKGDLAIFGGAELHFVFVKISGQGFR